MKRIFEYPAAKTYDFSFNGTIAAGDDFADMLLVNSFEIMKRHII